MFVEDPLIKRDSIEDRDYQRSLAASCLNTSTLVVLPTGMGKTVVALRVIAKIFGQSKGKVLILAPTKPLAEQHSAFFEKFLVGKKVCVLTGEKDPSEREVDWIQSDVIVSTPQVISNDLKSERISLDKVKLIIFDEAHRAVGNYAYVTIAESYRGTKGLVLGMTASPGYDTAKIREICTNLGICNIEVRSESDPDVVPYVHDILVDWVEVEVPEEMRIIGDILRKSFNKHIQQLITMGAMNSSRPPSIKYLLDIQTEIQARLRSGERNAGLYRGLSVIAMAIKVNHAIEMAETQGVTALRDYMEKLSRESLSEEGSKATRAIVSSEEFKKVNDLLKDLKMEHPKVSRVMSIVSHQLNERDDSRVMVFTQYRDACDMVANYLSRIPGARVARLFGQSGRGEEKGLRQKDQIEVLDKFRSGETNVLVATSVGEEGLDVANTDLVIFYEPVPSEIRSIQRRGRTGRSRAGKVIVMVTAGTRDEASLYSSERKEKNMNKRLRSLKSDLDLEGHKFKPLKVGKKGTG